MHYDVPYSFSQIVIKRNPIIALPGNSMSSVINQYCGSIIINNKPVKFLTLVILSFAKLLTLILFETALTIMLAIWGSFVKRDWEVLNWT